MGVDDLAARESLGTSCLLVFALRLIKASDAAYVNRLLAKVSMTSVTPSATTSLATARDRPSRKTRSELSGIVPGARTLAAAPLVAELRKRLLPNGGI